MKMWIPKYWRKFFRRLRLVVLSVSCTGLIFAEIEAAVSVLYGGTLSFFYLFGLFFLAGGYLGKIPVLLQVISSLRVPVVVFGLGMGHFLPFLLLEWTLVGFALAYPLLIFVFGKRELE